MTPAGASRAVAAEPPGSGEAPPHLERIFDLLAEGLWSRLRDILMAQSRWDGFVHDPAGSGPKIEPVPPSSEEAERVAGEMLLRALRVGVEPVSQAILLRLTHAEAVGLPALMELTGLPRVAVIERVKDLSQVGLASYAVETGEARATALAEGLLGFEDEVRGRLMRVMEEQWAGAPR